jgi:polysaccharide biosynthesis protein PslG
MLLALVAAGLAPAAAWATPAFAGRSVPPGFVGTDADGPLATDTSLFTSQLKPMVQAGVETLRMTFDWQRIQPYDSLAQVPPTEQANYRVIDGVPTTFTETDRWVAQAAKRGIAMFPVLLYAPWWAQRHPGHENSPPKNFDDYARFAATMVGRYGPDGSFWTERPDVPRIPIQYWQIWNEPHFSEFWSDRPWAGDYVKMLKRAGTAIHDVDPAAKIVLAGLANKSWKYLREIYRKGGRGHFDFAALHPFTGRVDGVLSIIRRARRVMRDQGDARRPLIVTELSWTSAKGKTQKTYGIEQDEQGQAKQLAHAYKLLAEKRRGLRLRAVFWYTWLTRDRSDVQPFDYAGIVRLKGKHAVKKPAYRALRRTAMPLEGCTGKTVNAGTCN